MAMLAEPRRKQKIINLRGGNKAWSEDSNKFGQKMLERMGWKSGKGLGAREDGVVSHVVARYKNDEKGLGYEERADQWTHHEDSFERLLANLATEGHGEKGTETSVESLEAKSKRSRARVHYHKFTRGKDLSRYSKKDLANIFGKKTLNEKTPATELASEADTVNSTPEVKVENANDAGQLFTTGGSMLDYFNKKLKAFGKQDLASSARRPSLDQDFSFRGFNTSVSDQPEEFSGDADRVKLEESSLKKNKKKRKKHIELDTDSAAVDTDMQQRDELIEDTTVRKKKRHVLDEHHIQVSALTECSSNSTTAHKKKKKKKQRD